MFRRLDDRGVDQLHRHPAAGLDRACRRPCGRRGGGGRQLAPRVDGADAAT